MRLNRNQHIALRLLFGAFVISIPQLLPGQVGTRSSNPDSLRMIELYDQARSLYSQELNFEALNSAEEALQYSMRLKKSGYEVMILEMIGDIFTSTQNPANAIPYYLRTASLMEDHRDSLRRSSVYEKIARAYGTEKVYSKETEYYARALSLASDANSQLRLKELYAIAAFKDRQFGESLKLFNDLESDYNTGGDDWERIIQYQVKTYDAAGMLDSALIHCQLLLPLYIERGDDPSACRLSNNIGYYQTLLGDYAGASGSYIEAINFGERGGANSVELAMMMTNAGVCFQNMEKRKRSVNYFNKAIQLLDEHGMYGEKSKVENMLATIYFQERDLYNAGEFSIRAIASAKEGGDAARLAEAYQTYSRVLREGNDPINALEYYEKYLSIRDSVAFENRISEQDLEERRALLELKERDIQMELKEEEVSDLAIQQLMLQNEKIEQEKELLMKEKNLQLLAQEKLEQDLVIARQLNEAAQRERENQALEQENRYNEKLRELDAQKLKDEEQKNEILQKQQRLDQLEIERQENTRKALMLILTGGFVIAVIILLLLISTRRKKKLLDIQKREIEEKNSDLEQKNEEISTQRDEIEAQRNLVFEQKEAIEAASLDITKSIEYAKRIQSSTLPDLAAIREFVPESFVLFRPRDIVSGDFFWFANVEGKTVLVVADSTGHGVPGAFMSMMGISMLKELVQKEYITHPGVVLRRMRKEIINTMGQKGISGEQRDGYDMSLITINHEEKRIDYAGAYNSLYLIRDNQYPPPQIRGEVLESSEKNGSLGLFEVQADKMPIAHYDRMDKFTNHEIQGYEGDIYYMFTDGYADQFGGEKGKKFMYKQFKKLLLKNARQPMQKQHELLVNSLEDWMGIYAQVDDICVMGVKL